MKQLVYYTTLGKVIYEDRYSPFVIPRKGESVIIPKNFKLDQGTTYTVHDIIYDYRTGIVAVKLTNS